MNIPVLVALCCICFVILVFLFIIAPGRASKSKKSPFFGRNIAHRGLYKDDQSIPENSITAFKRAVSSGYGIELDIQLSKDGKVVVFHDDTLGRVCSVSERVDSFDYDELKEMSLFSTDERIPLFTEVIKEIDGGTPVIVELKSGPRNDELCKKALDILGEYKGTFCVESFDPTIVAWFKKHAPKILRGQLSQPTKDYIKSGKKRFLSFVLGNTLLNFLARPQFIAYKVGKKPFPIKICELLGAMKVCWTSHNAESEKKYDVVIFEHYLPQKRFK